MCIRDSWIGTNGRPDVAAAHSIIAGGYKDKSPQLVKDCNDAVLHCQREPIEIKIWPIPPEDIRFVAWCDSSFDNNNVRHQIGWLDGVTTKYLNDGRKAPVSLLGWRSRKLPRKSGSPQLCETYAGSYCTADLNWVKCLLWSCFYANYDMLTQRPAHKPLPVRGPTVVRSDRPEIRDPDASVLSDSKGLYDAINNELPQDDKKSACETPIIEEMLKRFNGRVRWIPHNKNPSDG